MHYTILRPTAFMDNLNPTSPFGAAFASMWYTMPADKKLQLVSVRDIVSIPEPFTYYTLSFLASRVVKLALLSKGPFFGASCILSCHKCRTFPPSIHTHLSPPPQFPPIVTKKGSKERLTC
ncbi:hypothetical protein GGR56DRAFT_633534 [Xylariaceae sp. FL0804]|nr:hypothetical protein GGR56DRAFT_633534 [Xylariaceae sp. FL0804]